MKFALGLRARWCATLAASLVLTFSACRRETRPPRPPAASPDAAKASDARRAAAPPMPTPAPAAVPAPRRPLPPQLPAGKSVVLLHSANLRGEYDAHPLGGLGRRATLVAQLRQSLGKIVQVDVGDSLLPKLALGPGEPPADKGELDRRARLIAAGLGKLGLDAFVPGEGELQLGVRRVKELAQKARVPIVLANLVDARGKQVFEGQRMVEVGGVLVGLFGVLTLGEEDAKPLAEAKLTLSDALGAAQGATSVLRERGAEIVIGLVHLAGGKAEAQALGEAVSGVDLLVLGHDPVTLEDPAPVGTDSAPVAIVAAGERGRFVGRVDFHRVEGDSGFVIPRTLPAPLPEPVGSWLDHQILRLEPTLVSDGEMLALIAPYIQENRRRMDKLVPVGLTARAGTRGELADGAQENWTYATTNACVLCHPKQKEQFDQTSHAFSLQTLERRGRQRDPYCLGCHSTGFDMPGGTKNLATANKYFGSVGCESCHGPSVAHVRGQTKAGTKLKVPASVCFDCHRNEHSPERFDYETALKEVVGPGHGT